MLGYLFGRDRLACFLEIYSDFHSFLPFRLCSFIKTSTSKASLPKGRSAKQGSRSPNAFGRMLDLNKVLLYFLFYLFYFLVMQNSVLNTLTHVVLL